MLMLPPTKHSKGYIVKQISTSVDENKPLKKIIDEAYTNPEEYLNFYPKSKRVIFGKRPEGPRIDQNDMVIPYSIVGNPKYLRKKGGMNDSKNTSYYNQSRVVKTEKEEKKTMNQITDVQLASLFTQYKEKIMNNTTQNNDFLEAIPSIMVDRIQRPLLLQQRVLNDNIKTLNYRRKFEIRLAKSTQREEKDLLMQRTNAFRMKKERMEYIMNHENYDLRYGMNSWIIGLRRPKNFIGIRKSYMNYGTDSVPFWGAVREKMPIITETITNPGLENDQYIYDNSILNNYLSTSPNYKSELEKTSDLLNLKIEGKSLIEFEEENSKLMKGKKKLTLPRYNDELLKTVKICEKWK